MSAASLDSPISGGVDYWCNAFTSDRLPVWQRAIDNQGLSLKVQRVGDEFCDADAMVQRLDAAGFQTLILPVTASHAGAVKAGSPEGAGLETENSETESSEPQSTETESGDNFDQVACRAPEMTELAARYPGRFVGMWSVDPTTGTAGIEEAAEMLAQPWCVALHNHTHSWDRDFDHPDFTPFYRLCDEHDVPFVMQAGQSGGQFPHDCGRPEPIAGPAETFPSVSFVLSHTGWPWTVDTIAMVKRFPNVYLGTATWPLRHWPQVLRDFIADDGAAQTMFGSGFPTTGHRQAARQFADPKIGLPADVVAQLTSQTARTVFTRLPEIEEK